MDYYKSDSVFIEVIDVSALNEIDSKEYNAILVIHTWEYGEAPNPVQSFLDTHAGQKDKMVVMTTSGEGSEKMEDVDALVGESIIENAPHVVEEIIAQLNPLVRNEN